MALCLVGKAGRGLIWVGFSSVTIELRLTELKKDLLLRDYTPRIVVIKHSKKPGQFQDLRL